MPLLSPRAFHAQCPYAPAQMLERHWSAYPEAQACERGAPEPTSVAVGTGFRCAVLLPHVGGRREDANLDCHFGLCAGGDRGKRRDLEAPFYEAARIDPVVSLRNHGLGEPTRCS